MSLSWIRLWIKTKKQARYPIIRDFMAAPFNCEKMPKQETQDQINALVFKTYMLTGSRLLRISQKKRMCDFMDFFFNC